MPSYRFKSLAGTDYLLEHDHDLHLGGYSEAIYSWDNQTVWIRSCIAESCFATVTEVFETQFTEDLQLGDGRLLLGHYDSRDEDLGISLGRNTIAFWTDEHTAMWTDVGTRGADWAADLMAHLAPAAFKGLAFATRAIPDNVSLRHAELHVTVFPASTEEPPRKRVSLHPLNERTAPSTRGRPTQAGELYVRSRGQDRPKEVLLRTPSAIVAVSESDFECDSAVPFLEGFRRVERTPMAN